MEYPIKGTPYTLKGLQINDIPYVIDYWNQYTHNELESLGIDPDQIQKHGGLEAIYRARLRNEDKFKSPMTFILHEHEKNPIGMLNVYITEEIGHIHAHIFQTQKRQKGIGKQLFSNIMRFLFGNFNLKTIEMEPSENNKPVNHLLQSMGLSPQLLEKEFIPGKKKRFYRYQISRNDISL